jgi:hypothetical protein
VFLSNTHIAADSGLLPNTSTQSTDSRGRYANEHSSPACCKGQSLQGDRGGKAQSRNVRWDVGREGAPGGERSDPALPNDRRKPFYVPGPSESPDQVRRRMAQLRARFGDGCLELMAS